MHSIAWPHKHAYVAARHCRATAGMLAILGATLVAPSFAADRTLIWERIENICPRSSPSALLTECAFTERLKVPGGWLVRSTRMMREPGFSPVPGGPTGGGIGVGTGLTFLPDPTDSWQP